jgi:CBS domain containing-hemolysin-like protein
MQVTGLLGLEDNALQSESFATVLLKLLTVIFLVLLNGFFVASEFAIVKVRASQLDALIERQEKRARFARHVVTHLDSYLSATQLGITLASLALGWLGEPFVAQMLEPLFAAMQIRSPIAIEGISFGIAFAVITFLHIVLGELAPKSLAIRKAVGTTLWVSKPLGAFYTVFKPVIWLLNGAASAILKHVLRIPPVREGELAHSEEELRLIIAESEKAHALSPRAAEISANALNLRLRTARDIMTSRRDVVFLNLEDSFEDNLRRAKESRHSRFPLCRRDLDDAVGVIHIKDIVPVPGEPVPELLSVKREVLAVPEMMTLEILLDLFRMKHAHLGLVVDEYGGSVGIATLDNVIEELVGRVYDEFDADDGEFKVVGDGEFIAKGSLPLYQLNELAGLDIKSGDVITVGGYITQLLGRLPREGDKVQIGPYAATVREAGPRRVRVLHLKR